MNRKKMFFRPLQFSLLLEESLLKTAFGQLNEYSSLIKPETAIGRKVNQICDRHF